MSVQTSSMLQRKLWEAAMKGDSAMIRILATSGADLDARDDDGLTPFAIATQNNHADAAMTILAMREAQFMKTIGANSSREAASADALKRSA